jgi:hypothetical protein
MPINVGINDDTKPAYDQYSHGRHCGNCGTTVPGPRTAVIDWREDWLCDKCIASFDWSDWQCVYGAYIRFPPRWLGCSR